MHKAQDTNKEIIIENGHRLKQHSLFSDAVSITHTHTHTMCSFCLVDRRSGPCSMVIVAVMRSENQEANTQPGNDNMFRVVGRHIQLPHWSVLSLSRAAALMRRSVELERKKKRKRKDRTTTTTKWWQWLDARNVHFVVRLFLCCAMLFQSPQPIASSKQRGHNNWEYMVLCMTCV